MKNEDIVLMLSRIAAMDDLKKMRVSLVTLAARFCDKRTDDYEFGAEIVISLLDAAAMPKKRLVKAAADGAMLSLSKASALIDRMTTDGLIRIDKSSKIGSNRSIVYIKCSGDHPVPKYVERDLPEPEVLPAEQHKERARKLRREIIALMAAGLKDRELVIDRVQSSTNSLRCVVEKQYKLVVELGLTAED